jgi:hypothetical protein
MNGAKQNAFATQQEFMKAFLLLGSKSRKFTPAKMIAIDKQHPIQELKIKKKRENFFDLGSSVL